MPPGRAQARRSLQCWACELQAKLLAAAVGVAGAAGMVYMMETSVFKIPTWIPICCESRTAEGPPPPGCGRVPRRGAVALPCRTLGTSRSAATPPATRRTWHPASSTARARWPFDGCPVEFPNRDWSTCYWNGSYAISEEPAWGAASLVPHALAAFAAGLLLGGVPVRLFRGSEGLWFGGDRGEEEEVIGERILT
ncbi:unnamed protein product [Prorocentrum cordatum]|uniref:Uncharacterized protein n=1 Tax=Prorocentrum cordatum TaxID=2364126 RepID=A0ABN9QB67_9DINO|nr:unnamed protein product [Polarella glacialis]